MGFWGVVLYGSSLYNTSVLQKTTELKNENEKLKEELSAIQSKPAKKQKKVPADLSVSCRFTHGFNPNLGGWG